jgi:hypothetical protein
MRKVSKISRRQRTARIIISKKADCGDKRDVVVIQSLRAIRICIMSFIQRVTSALIALIDGEGHPSP